MTRDRIKLLVKKMCRKEAEELCERKRWTIISLEDAKNNLDLIHYKNFWLAGRDDSDEDRPYVSAFTDNGLKATTCHENFMMNVVVLKEEQTPEVIYRDAIDKLKDVLHELNKKGEAFPGEMEDISRIVEKLIIIRAKRGEKDERRD